MINDHAEHKMTNGPPPKKLVVETFEVICPPNVLISFD
jgi:hypothetical protein